MEFIKKAVIMYKKIKNKRESVLIYWVPKILVLFGITGFLWYAKFSSCYIYQPNFILNHQSVFHM
jgi:hypothetical protein